MFASCSSLEEVSYNYDYVERYPVTVTYVSYYPEWYVGFNTYWDYSYWYGYRPYRYVY